MKSYWAKSSVVIADHVAASATSNVNPQVPK